MASVVVTFNVCQAANDKQPPEAVTTHANKFPFKAFTFKGSGLNQVGNAFPFNAKIALKAFYGIVACCECCAFGR